MHGGTSDYNQPNKLPARQIAEDPVEEASEESFPASDSPAWNAGRDTAPTPPSPVQTDKTKQGCAVSAIGGFPLFSTFK
jgi:hypothetical protein